MVEATPVPLSETFSGELVALLVTVTVPAKVPAVAGAKLTPKEADCPADRVSGATAPVRV